jgi:hypothetical protein
MTDSRRRLPHWVPDDVLHNQQSSVGGRFVAADSELDWTTSGPLWLRDRRVAGMVAEALQYGAAVKRWYELHGILQWLKGMTAKRAKLQKIIRYVEWNLGRPVWPTRWSNGLGPARM